MSNIYRIGISASEIGLEENDIDQALQKLGLVFKKVFPIEQILRSAKDVIGRPYKRGASVSNDAPNFFDCSSLVAWGAVEAGISIPRISIDQFVFSQRINEKDLKEGDLVFANTKEKIHTAGKYFSKVLGKEVEEEPIRTKTLEYLPGTLVPEGVDHVGLYVGDGKIIHASIKANGVNEENLSNSQQFKNIVGYGRIINNNEKRFVIEIPEEKKEFKNRNYLINEIKKLI